MTKNIIIISLFLIISACSSNNNVVPNPITGKKSNPGLFSSDSEKGVTMDDLLGSKGNNANGIYVNGYLWRASLNILSIAPLISTDALGGTIITDWYINNNIKNQRIKITAYIKTTELRSEGISVKVHIQNFKNNSWSEVFTDNNLATSIEDNILNEARNLRINSIK
jgi:hypothetical protein